VDIGGGTSEVAVISLGGIASKSSIRTAGNMDAEFLAYAQREYKLTIGSQTAEQLKVELGSALPLEEEKIAEIRGRDLVTGLPKPVTITSEEIRKAISNPLNAIIAAILDTLGRTSLELASDVMDRGMILAGGTKLRLLDGRIRQKTGIPVHVADDPLMCVAIGTGRFLEEIETYRNTLHTC
jgi:rod shape-determining protein MreB